MIPRRPLPAARGAALIVVLAVLVLLTILVVSMTLTMRTELQSARSYNQRNQAEFMAREAVEAARAALEGATTNGNAWASMPGQILYYPTNAPSPIQTNALGSGAVSNALAGALAPADLNRPVYSDDSQDAISPGAGPVRVNWDYVRQDGTVETNQAPAALTNNPVIGRFAYWTDDESCRIDLNTAYLRDPALNTNWSSHPSQVDLRVLGGAATNQAAAIQSAATNWVFNSPDEARRLDPALGDVLSSNRFATTHYTHTDTPGANPWGEAKIVLTTQARLASGHPYLNVLKAANTDPGSLTSISAANLTATLNTLTNLFSRPNWPYLNGNASFVSKYGATGAIQLALDVIEYVRSVESTSAIVEPIRLTPGAAGAYDYANPGAASLIGTTRRPMITEMGVTVDAGTPVGSLKKYASTSRVEIYLPPAWGIASSLLSGKTLAVSVAGNNSASFAASGSIGSAAAPITAGTGGFYTVTLNGASTNSSRPATVYLRAVLNTIVGSTDLPIGSAWDVAPSSQTLGYPTFPSYPLDAASVALSAAASVQVNDPRVNRFSSNWQPGANTFGAPNFNWAADVAASPPQDNASARTPAASLFMPPPKGTAPNTDGVVHSVAELGHIATGITVGTVTSETVASVPWRTVRLQPAAGSPAPPDWALLDLFAAPAATTATPSPYLPNANVLAGRINLNAQTPDFTNLVRVLPLQALFSRITNSSGTPLSASATTLLASNIASHVLASGGTNYLASATNQYLSAGQLCEIAGVADQGKESEGLLRQAFDLATVQGNVFRIYARGQALKQTPAGVFVVQADTTVLAMVERYQNGAGQIRFRTIYWKAIPF